MEGNRSANNCAESFAATWVDLAKAAPANCDGEDCSRDPKSQNCTAASWLNTALDHVTSPTSVTGDATAISVSHSVSLPPSPLDFEFDEVFEKPLPGMDTVPMQRFRSNALERERRYADFKIFPKRTVLAPGELSPPKKRRCDYSDAPHDTQNQRCE